MFLIKFGVRVLVFGVALALATRVVPRVRIEPRSALPMVALTFALLNSFLYWFISFAMNLFTLWLLWFIVPFLANAVLLWLTDKLLKPFKIDGGWPLLHAAGIITLAHVALRVAPF
ncbi:MAG: phage holin family protein [Deltaproteobacteria bacterium]|nr:phage holin family protein [Deltaproteobacteria bacterium]